MSIEQATLRADPMISKENVQELMLRLEKAEAAWRSVAHSQERDALPGNGLDPELLVEAHRVIQQLAQAHHRHEVNRDHQLALPEMLETIIDAMLDPVTFLDAEGIFIRANPAAVEVYGFDPVGLPRQDVFRRLSLQHLDGRPVKVEELTSSRALQGEKVQPQRFHFGNLGGRSYSALATATPIYSHGRLTGVVQTWHDVTLEDRLVEENLRQKALLEGIFQADPGGIAVLASEELVVRMVNPAFIELLPDPQDNPLERRWEEIWLKEEVIDFSRCLRQVLASGETLESDKISRRFPDGTRRTFAYKMQPIAWEDQPAVLLYIWETTQKEQAIQHAQQRAQEAEGGKRILEAILDAVPATVWISTDPDCQVVTGNRASYDLLRMPYGSNQSKSAPEREATDHFQVFHDGVELSPEELPLQRSAASGIEIRDYEEEIAFTDGMVRHVTGNVTPIMNDKGKPQGAVAAFVDITSRVRVEKALRESEERYRSLFEKMQEGFALLELVTDAEGQAHDYRFLEINPGFEHITGVPRKAMIGQRALEFYPRADLMAVDRFIKVAQTGEAAEFELYSEYLGKHLGVNAFSPLPGKCACLITDVTARKESEAALRRARDELEVRIEERTHALAETNRELRIEISERQRAESELAELQRRLMDRVEAERLIIAQELHDGPMQEIYGLTYSLAALVDSLNEQWLRSEVGAVLTKLAIVNEVIRTIARELRPPTLAPFGLKRAIQDHSERFWKQHEGVEVQLDLMLDRTELPEQVRLALFRIYQVALTNVIRHSKATRVSVRFNFDEHSVRLEIQDNGVGFVVPKRWINLAREGHLGLVGAAERAEAFGGRLEVESQAGMGTLVRVNVPRQVAAGQESQPV